MFSPDLADAVEACSDCVIYENSPGGSMTMCPTHVVQANSAVEAWALGKYNERPRLRMLELGDAMARELEAPVPKAPVALWFDANSESFMWDQEYSDRSFGSQAPQVKDAIERLFASARRALEEDRDLLARGVLYWWKHRSQFHPNRGTTDVAHESLELAQEITE